MDIGKFVEEFDQSQAKDRVVKKHIVTNYISYEVKISEANKIIKHSFYTDVDGEETYLANSPVRYILFMMAVIRSYTDLEFDNTNAMIQFDLLESRGIIEMIIELIGQDYERFQTVLNMTIDDLMSNERSLVSYFDRKLTALGKTISELTTQLEAQQAAASE